MYIVSNKGHVTEWHVGEKANHPVQTVFEVQADGHELEAIKRMLPNVPLTEWKTSERFYGVLAKEIVGRINLG